MNQWKYLKEYNNETISSFSFFFLALDDWISVEEKR